MTYKIHRINTFSHPIFGDCVDVKCIDSILQDNQFIHFIVPNDEFYLQPINFAFNLKAEWTPDINDYTIDFVSDLFDFPKLERRTVAKGFVHKGFYIEPNAPFKFKIRGASRVVDEYYSIIKWERDVFNCPRRIASELCLVRASQVDSKRIRPNSDINEPMSKTVRFLFPLNEDLLKPIFQTKEDGVIWESDSILFSFDKFTKIINDDYDFPDYKQIPVLVYHTLFPNLL